jgi:hypothetical protein
MVYEKENRNITSESSLGKNISLIWQAIAMQQTIFTMEKSNVEIILD